MDIDPLEIAAKNESGATAANDAAAVRRERLNNAVAISIALLATFMGICKVKDDNIVQAMQQAQVDRNDNWAWYQARNIRKDVYTVTADEIHALKDATTSPNAAGIDALAAKYEKQASDQQKKMDDVKAKAEDCAKSYDDLNYHDDQFDLMDAALSIAIAMLAVTSLTQAWWLFILALFPTAFGVLMGAAGLFSWNIHPDTLAKWLGT